MVWFRRPLETLLLVLVGVALIAAAPVGPAAAHFGCPGKNVRFTASDGTKLVAHRYGTSRKFVVLAHQDGADLCQWYPYVKKLVSYGYSALPFDLRGFGESQTRSGAAAKRYELDVTAAVKLARQLKATKVFVIGASMGGWAALYAAPDIAPPIAGLVSLSTPPQYVTDVFPSVRRLTVPVLYVASRGEGLADETQALYDATPSHDKTIRIVKGNAHGVALISPTLGKPSWQSVRGMIKSFLRTH